MLVFTLCFAKLYLISLLQGVVTFYAAEIEPNTTQMRLSFIFGLLIFSSAIDNMKTPKLVAVCLQIFLALTWVCLGLNNSDIIYKEKSEDIVYLLHPLEDLAQILSAGIIIINILQVYNWFMQKYITTMIGLYFIAQFLGYMTPVPGQVTVITKDEGMFMSKPYIYYICAGAMFLLGLLDIVVFQFNPMQKNIFLDQEKGSHYFNKSNQDPFEIEAYEGDRSESRASAFSPHVIASGPRHSRSITSD